MPDETLTTDDAPRGPTKLTFDLDGGAVMFPLRNGTILRLTEPSWRQIADLHDAASEADAALPTVPDLPTPPAASASVEEKQVYLDALQKIADAQRARERMMRSLDSPHAKAMVVLIKTLTNTDVDPDLLPGWVTGTRAMRAILDQFTDPLGGGSRLPAQ